MTESDKNLSYLERVEASLEGAVAGDLLCKDDLFAWYKFLVYLVNLAEADGWVYDGHSLKVQSPMSILCVRGTIDGVPHVVFSSGRTTTGCIRAFLRKMEEGWLEWRPDQFRS